MAFEKLITNRIIEKRLWHVEWKLKIKVFRQKIKLGEKMNISATALMSPDSAAKTSKISYKAKNTGELTVCKIIHFF